MTAPTPLSMASAVTEETSALRAILDAYVGLEKLLAQAPENEAIPYPEPTELQALLGMLNGGMHRQIERIEIATGAMVRSLKSGVLAAPEPGC